VRNARLVARGAALAAWTAALFLLWALGALPALLKRGLPTWRAWMLSSWSRGVCRLLGLRLGVDGPRPRGAFLLVANHLSYLDVVVLSALVPCAFVAKAEVARWPVLGFLARAMGTLFVPREDRRALGGLNARLAARLARGETLVLFPEGTSTAGVRVISFRPALLQPAAELGLAVRYAALRYATPAGERPPEEVVCWWGDMTFAPHLLELLRLPRVEALVRFGPEPISAQDRKTLAARLERAVSERLEPLPSHA
jgi:1-acyl-sn-glycerol-3-phosphate acyltransferase